jgi:hypothetical protein
MTKRHYVPAPVDIDAIDRTIAQSIAAIERSCALLSRLNRVSFFEKTQVFVIQQQASKNVHRYWLQSHP